MKRQIVVDKASRERPYWIVVTALLVLLSAISLFSMLDTRRQLDASRQQEQALRGELDNLKVQGAVTQGQGNNSNSGGGTVPEHISVQHVLIGFKDAIGFGGNAPVKAQSRTKEQAQTLAYEILDKAKGGANFDELVTQYTDDSPPGIYGMANTGVTPATGEYQREGMVAAFGNVGFDLEVGEIGIADYDPQKSPFGYHIIKRIK